MRFRLWLVLSWAVALVAAAPKLYASSTGGLILGTGGSITSDPNQVIDGTRSILAVSTGTSYVPVLGSDTNRLPFQRNQTYRVTFRYKVLTAPGQGLNVNFYSPTQGAQGGYVPGQAVNESPGSTGTITLTNTLGPFDDYGIYWGFNSPGSVVIDDIQIVNTSTGAILATEDAEPGTELLSNFFVSANQTAFIWGTPIKITAALYDENANVIPLGPVTWTVTPPAAASIAADGTLTPLALTTFTVKATVQGFTGTVLMQSLPSQIVVTPQQPTMMVGATQRIQASVLDVNSQPIPNAVVNWSISSELGNGSSSATIDSSGLMKGVYQARVRVVASIAYSQTVQGFDVLTEGYALVDIEAPTTYQFERIFVAKQPNATSSKLAPRTSALIPTESGGFMFSASLDGLGTALLEWNNGSLTPVLPSGRINLTNGFPLESFVGYGRTSGGNILVEETDLSGSKVISGGLTGSLAPLFASGSAVFGAQNTYSFDLTRNSLADSGAMLLYVGYQDAVTHLNQSGLFRGFGGGISEPIINSRDSRLANGSLQGGVQTWGIANDATAWFIGGYNQSLWRSQEGQTLEQLITNGQQIGNATITGLALNYTSTEENFFVAANGDEVNAVYTNKGPQFLLWHSGDTAPSATLAVNDPYGLYWYNPNVGALIDADFPGKSRGLYLWNSSGTKPLLLLNDKTLDGSPVQQIVSATSSSDGTIYVMARTSNSPMVIASLTPSPQVLLSAEDDIPVTVPPMIAALIPGARTGMPLIIAGGATGSIAQMDESGNISPIVAIGTKLPDGKYYAGSKLSMVRSTKDGRIVFGEDYFANDSSLYTWNQGAIQVTVQAPLKHPDGTQIGSADNVQVNSQGDIAFYLHWNCCGLYRIHNGTLTTAIDVKGTATVDGVTVQGLQPGGLDDAGNMVFSGNSPDGLNTYLGLWNGNAAHLIMSPGFKMPDGRQVTSVSNFTSSCSDGFLTGALGTVARYQNGAWNYFADPSQPMPTGDPANNLRLYDSNGHCDTVFTFVTQANGVTNVGARVAGTYDEIQDLQQLTVAGDLLTVVQMLINDDGTIFILGGNDQGQEVIYRATPLPAAFPPPPSSLNFQISDKGGISNTSAGTSSAVQVGFAQIRPANGSATPSGMAIFGFRPNGVLISEAAVPASPLIQSGRLYAEITSPVDTGIAIANPNNQAATISFYYSDANGAQLLSGKTTVAANGQISAFLDQAPFIQPGTAPNFAAVRTFTFTSSLPIGVTALRGYTNERSEFLITTLPISPLSSNSTAALAFPHYADGGGWMSSVVLINPGDTTISGTVQFYSNGTTTTPGAPVSLLANGNATNIFNYSIAPRSAFKLQTAGAGLLKTGWVSVTPSSGNVAPSGLVVFSFVSNGIRVSEAGVPALPSSSAFRMYAEASGSIQSGIAISNPASTNATVNFALTNLDGTATGITGSTTVPATGQIAMFLNQLPGFGSLPASFKGVLRITGSNIYVTGLRGRYNERGDFLITTTPPVDETATPSNAQLLLPQLADGGGYTTQIILFSGAAGQSTSGVLQFVSQSGQPLGLLLQ
jgi:hypothetical protein